MVSRCRIQVCCKRRGVNKQRHLENTTRSRLNALNRSRRGNCSTGLKLDLEPAIPPSRNNEVGPDEDISGKQHAEDELEEEDELFESLRVGGGNKGRDGGSGGNPTFRSVGPLRVLRIMMTGGGNAAGRRSFLILAPVVTIITLIIAFAHIVGVAGTGVARELITTDAGLLLFLGLVTTLNLALVEAALDTESEGIRDLCWGGTCARS